MNKIPIFKLIMLTVVANFLVVHYWLTLCSIVMMYSGSTSKGLDTA